MSASNINTYYSYEMWPTNYKTAETATVATTRERAIESKKDLTDASQGLRFRHLPIETGKKDDVENCAVDTETTASLVTATTVFPMAQKTSKAAVAAKTTIKQRKRLQAVENTRILNISDQHYLHNQTTTPTETSRIGETTTNNLSTASYTHYSQVRSKNAGVGTKVATSDSATTTSTSATISTSDSSTSSPHLYCTTSKTHSSRNIHTMATPLYAWLLVLLCLIAYFGFGQAGFACLSNPCVFGVCIDGLNSSYSCYCIDGYTGIQCQTNWDECWSGPCLNGGTCVDGVAYYNCTCPVGFTVEPYKLTLKLNKDTLVDNIKAACAPT